MRSAATAYHGVGALSGRPGAVLLFDDRLVFAPFSARETVFAIFSRRGRLELPVGDFAVEQLPVSVRIRFLFGLVAGQAHLRLRSVAGETHDLLLRRGVEELLGELEVLGVRVEGSST